MKTICTLNLLFLIAAFMLPTQSQAQNKGVEHVVIIGIDGLSAEVVRENPEDFPTYNYLAKIGSSTLEMRSVLPSSSAVNWASHLMGAGPELHGYTTWGSKTPDLPSRVLTENGMFPCIFWAAKQKFPESESAVAYNWDGIGFLYDTLSVDKSCFTTNDEQIVDTAGKYLTSQPKLSFFYFAQPDGAGHSKGWKSKDYNMMASKIDSLAGLIVQRIKDAGMFHKTVILYVSDHGGLGTGHGGKTMAEMQVPFAIAGPGIKADNKIEGSTMVFDTAPTVAGVLGLDRPQVWIGRPIVEAFEKPNKIK